jgi:Bacterial Ig domain
VTARPGLAALALFLLPLACTTNGSNYSYLPTTGAGGIGTQPPSGSVTVTFVSPTDGTVVSDSTDVNVSVTVDDSGTDFIDTSSVKMALTAKGSSAPLSSGQLVSGGGDTYSGTISIGNLPTGSYTLTVSATSSSGVMGQATVMLTIQGGPTLIVNSPAQGQPYNDSLTIEILVDPGASPPTATLAGMPVTMLTLVPSANPTYDVYRETVWFGPPPTPAGAQPFPTLSGSQLLDVKESNGVATSEVQRTFIIDTSGPSITLTTPLPGAVVGGVVDISATITDQSGVLDSSVFAIIGDDQGNPLFNLQLEPQGSGVYGILFDTLNLTQCAPPPATSLCIVFPTISFRASDSVGNESSLGYDFSVDNVPPLSDLDPPQLRQMRLSAAGYQCSFLFDPLSVNQDVGDMPNDGCMVPQVFDLRARIEDQGNRASGLKITPIAGIDPDNTSVYVLTDNSQPLVVDSDGDGNCDTINPLLAPTIGPLTQSGDVLEIRLAGVAPAGAANFLGLPIDTTLPASAPCTQGTDTALPKVLCTIDGFEQPTIAISYAGGLPNIWSVEPIDPARCLGNQLDTRANNIPDGQWICIAVETADLVGNKGVSRPMRVYVQYDDSGAFCAPPPAGAPAPPPCTGTYDPTSKIATVGTCQTLKFPSGEIYCAPGGC